jgi:hypothetical protein
MSVAYTFSANTKIKSAETNANNADFDSRILTHNHSGSGSAQLDWDDIWADAVHSHASAAEGGNALSPDSLEATSYVNTAEYRVANVKVIGTSSTNLTRFFDRAAVQFLEVDTDGHLRTPNHYSVLRREDAGVLPTGENGHVLPFKNSGNTTFRLYFYMNGAWRNAGPD